MITNADRAHMLERAARLVDKVAETLNNEHEICASCGHKHYENWTEHQGVMELEAQSQKLRRWAGRFDAAAEAVER